MAGCYDVVRLVLSIQKAGNLGINTFTSLSGAGSESVRLNCLEHHLTEMLFADGYYDDLVYASDDFPSRKAEEVPGRARQGCWSISPAYVRR